MPQSQRQLDDRSAICRLSRADQDLITELTLHSGSLKALAKSFGVTARQRQRNGHMIDWNSPNDLGAILGASLGLLGALCGVWGACVGVFAPKGIHRGPILATGYAFTALGVAIGITGIVLLISGAAFVLWFIPLVSGADIAILMYVLVRVARRRYAQAEERIMSAESLRRE